MKTSLGPASARPRRIAQAGPGSGWGVVSRVGARIRPSAAASRYLRSAAGAVSTRSAPFGGHARATPGIAFARPLRRARSSARIGATRHAARHVTPSASCSRLGTSCSRITASSTHLLASAHTAIEGGSLWMLASDRGASAAAAWCAGSHQPSTERRSNVPSSMGASSGTAVRQRPRRKGERRKPGTLSSSSAHRSRPVMASSSAQRLRDRGSGIINGRL